MLICDHASPECPAGCPCVAPHPYSFIIYGTTRCIESEMCPHVLQIVRCVEVEINDELS